MDTMPQFALQYVTKYLGPTDTKPSRIKVTDYTGKSKVYQYDHALSWSEQDWRAVQRMIKETQPDADAKILTRAANLTTGYTFHVIM